MLKEAKRKKISLIVSGLFLATLFFGLCHFALAQDVGTSTAEIANYNRNMIAKIVNIILLILAAVDIGFIIYAGWLWMKSDGDEDKIIKAKKILLGAGVGLIILLLLFFIINWILSKMMVVSPPVSDYEKGKGKQSRYAIAGNKAIEYHYPIINQQGVPRNSKIAITFRREVNKDSIIQSGKINSANVFIYKTVNGVDGGHLVDVRAEAVTDNKTFVFKPEELLGSPSENTWYTVSFSRNLKRLNNEAVFVDIDGDVGYYWTFEVGTSTDAVPPRIESIVPGASANEARNSAIQINFNKPIDPTTLVGNIKDGFNNIVIKDIAGAGIKINGTFYISNIYRTVEFLPEEACGQNFCGQIVYCLPEKGLISTLVRAATVSSGTSTGSIAKYPYDGVVDMNDNSFDGNHNNRSEGPQAQSLLPEYNQNATSKIAFGDDFVWSFYTNSLIDMQTTSIKNIKPKINEFGVGLDTSPEIDFTRYMLLSSLVKDNVSLFAKPDVSEVFYWFSSSASTTAKQTNTKIRHEQFYSQSQYTPEFDYGAKDIYQNCYSPSSGPSCTPDLEAGRPYCCNGQKTTGNCQNQN